VREGLLVVACIALVLAAAGLLMWQWAKTRQARQATERHLNQQILASATAATAAAWAGAAPAPGMCWYYTDPSRTQGFWDYCQ